MFCTCNNGVMYSYPSVNGSKVGFHLSHEWVKFIELQTTFKKKKSFTDHTF